MLKVVTNNHVRTLEYAVPEWTDEEVLSFTYKGERYFLDEFTRIDERSLLFPNWDGYLSDSFFSGIVIRFPVDYWEDGIVVGSYYEHSTHK